jgi:hypothetical protein
MQSVLGEGKDEEFLVDLARITLTVKVRVQ